MKLWRLKAAAAPQVVAQYQGVAPTISVLIAAKSADKSTPSAVNAPINATLINAAINPYSIAVAPFSLL